MSISVGARRLDKESGPNARRTHSVSRVVRNYSRNMRDERELRPRAGVKLCARERRTRRRVDSAANRGKASR